MARHIVGFDIGNSALKICERDGEGLRLVCQALPENMMVDDVSVAPHALSDLIRKACSSNHIHAKSACLTLPESRAFFRHVTLPPMTTGELKLNLPYEFRDYIDGDPADYVFDYAVDEVVKDEEGKPERLELYAAAVERESMNDTRETFRRSGRQLAYATPAAMALSRLVTLSMEDKPELASEGIIFMDLGYDNISVSLYEGDRYQASRVIDIGLRELDQAIADLRGVDRYTASTYKRSDFEGVLEEQECMDLYERIAIEVNKVVNFYNFSNRSMDIDTMYLLGGGANITSLVKTLEEQVNVKVASIAEILPASFRGSHELETCALAVAGMLEGEAM
jgi:type IV pilus assembly protein PilM